jgi:hypothetical protein
MPWRTTRQSIRFSSGKSNRAYIIEQHIGMPFIIIMQQQPGMLMQVIMQSQQAWIILTQLASPLLHIIFMPMSIISKVQAPMVILQQHIIMPLHMQHMEHMPPAIMLQRFCIIMALVLSSQTHMHIMPSAVFCIFMVQRGIIMPIWPIIDGIMLGMPLIEGLIMDIGFIMGIMLGMLDPLMLMLPIAIPRSVLVRVIASLL